MHHIHKIWSLLGYHHDLHHKHYHGHILQGWLPPSANSSSRDHQDFDYCLPNHGHIYDHQICPMQHACGNDQWYDLLQHLAHAQLHPNHLGFHLH